jgi:hypothetical protein
MSWLARLKKTECAPAPTLRKLQKGDAGVSVVFVGIPLGDIEKTQSVSAAANDPAPDPDRWCWPASEAMNTREIDTFTARLARFTDKGLSIDDGEALADKLVMRDREQDTRRLCLECKHLGGWAGSWRCGNWQAAQVAIRARDVQLPHELVTMLQHCTGFKDSIATP